MKFELFIANRLRKRDLRLRKLSYLIIQITTVAVALSLATMIISVAIVKGFRNEIEYKVSHFVGHILITKHTSNKSFELEPVRLDSLIYERILSVKDVDYVQVFGLKAGLAKREEVIEGVVLKGIWKDFNWDFFEHYLVDGRPIRLPENKPSKEIVISQELARRLNYKVGDNVIMFFVEKPLRIRKFEIVGIYNTGLVDFDKIYVLADIRQVQRLNNWDVEEGFWISGYEVFIKDFRKLEEVTRQLKLKVAFSSEWISGEKLKVQNVKELYPDIFDWLALIDVNVIVILTIMLIIAILNMTTGLLIIILEKTNFIGILRALGASNGQIVRIFLAIAWFILRRGLLVGNLIGLGFVILEKQFKIIPLNPETYYVSYVPVSLNLVDFLMLNLFTIFITLIFMILPAMIATKIEPVKTIKFQ